MDFYSYIENNGAGSSLKRVALGFFPFTPEDKENKLRGVVALKKIAKGDVRDKGKIKTSYQNHDAFMHLACISNDINFVLD